MDIKELTFNFQGIPINYKVFGKGKPVLVLHGWGANSDVMLPITTTLRLKRTFYLIDFPGFGKSGEPSIPWDVGNYTEMTAAFINEIIKEPVDILAHSFGGRVSLKLCSNNEISSLAKKVIITGGAGMKPRRSLKFYFKKYFALTLKFPFTLLPGGSQKKGLDWLRSTKLWKSLGSSDYKSLNGVMRQTFVKTVSEYLEPTLPNISHEILLLWGANDDTTPIYQAKIMERGIKNAGLAVIDHAGHYAFLDRPNQFRVITEAFFNS